MNNDIKNSMQSIQDVAQLIQSKYKKVDMKSSSSIKDFLMFINGHLCKDYDYDFIHFFTINPDHISHIKSSTKSVLFEEKTYTDLSLFDEELKRFNRLHFLSIDCLNSHEVTVSQSGIIFDTDNANQSLDVPLYLNKKIIGFIRFEALLKPFSVFFEMLVIYIFHYLKSMDLEMTHHDLNNVLTLKKTYLKSMMKDNHFAVFHYHFKTKEIVWEKGSEKCFNLDHVSDLTRSFFIERVHPDDFIQFNMLFSQVTKDHIDQSMVLRISIDDDKRWYLVHLKHTTIQNDAYIIGVVDDITNPLSKVSDFDKYQNHLDALSKEKIKELEKAKDHAEQESKSKASFISNMSHEIRTPMNSIIGYAHLLESLDLSDDQREYVTRINDASKHLLSVVNDILDMSKLEAGKIVIEKTAFQLDQLLQSLKSIFEETILQKRLYFDIETLHCPNFLIGDETRIKQVLINLISNAIKFTETGGISLVVSSDEYFSHQETHVKFVVKDTGIGMSPQQVKRLFRDFEQADISTTRLYGGTGLGLSISKKLAHLMQGDLDVESKLNDGTEFILTLPMTIQHDNLEKKTDHELHQTPKKGSKILLAEDNLLNQKLAERILKNMGMDVQVVSNGSLALDMMKKHSFDLIILDVQMPIMDGLEAARNIRLFDQKTPIIAMTANTLSEDRQACFDAGMNDYVVKPIDPKSFYKALVRWIPDINE